MIWIIGGFVIGFTAGVGMTYRSFEKRAMKIIKIEQDRTKFVASGGASRKL